MEERLLVIYLRDHLAAGQGGIALTKRIRAQNQGHAVAALMGKILPELEEEAAVLRKVLKALGPGPSRLKIAAALTGEKVARLKANGRWMGYSPLSRIYELEALSVGVLARQGLWRTLREIAPADPRLRHLAVDRYAERADRQLDEVVEMHRQAVGSLIMAEEEIEGVSAADTRPDPNLDGRQPRA
ncbi:MAG: hypothetical protein ACNA8W_20945 [Bradymonadaceae bacterium]